MLETFDIVEYCLSSVDEALDRENISVINQNALIQHYVNRQFSGSKLTIYLDRDRPGYTFERCERYQAMRKGLLAHKYDILIVKVFSRFSRRNARGLVKPKADMDAVLGSAEMTEASILREQSESKNPALDSSAGPQNDRNGSAADVSDAVPFGITIIEEALHHADRVFTVHAVSEGDPSGTKRRLAGALRDAVPHDFGSGTGRGIAANRCEFGFAEFLL